jgi:hypothetical protein
MAKTTQVNSNIRRIISILLLAVVGVASFSQAKTIRKTLRAEKITITLPENVADASRPREERRQGYDKQTVMAGSTWQTIMTEGFEGVFPSGDWNVFSGSSGRPTWDGTDYDYHFGSHSCWCAADKRDPTGGYVDQMDAWAVFGPFSLEDAQYAKLDFWYKNYSEPGYDYFGWLASINGTSFSGSAISGNSNGWVAKTFDLTNVYSLGNLCGQSQVWIAFLFQSDDNISGPTYTGAYIDDIILQSGGVCYVDVNATGANDGTSWTNAYLSLQDALYFATAGDEIWVAQGTYTPTHLTDFNDAQSATFQLINGVAIYGGFPSGGGNFDDRNPKVYETVLSGDPNGDDITIFNPLGLRDEPTRADNAYHVVTGSGTDETSVLDGFMITAGHANNNGSPTTQEGGGMFIFPGSPTVSNCVFKGNSAYLKGGGLFAYNGNPILTNCVFSRNSAGFGGAVCIQQYSNPTLTNCIFVGNQAIVGGGGLSNIMDSEPTLTNCTFYSNSSILNGSGVYNLGFCNPTLTNCILWNAGIEIYNDSSYATNVVYSNISSGWPGVENIVLNPLLTPDGHLLSYSPCINAGDPNFTITPNVPNDIDGETRILNDRVDIGADEFLDSDGDGLPDWWEHKHFGEPNIAEPNTDSDLDGFMNIDEYQLYSGKPNSPPYYVDTNEGNDAYDGLAITPQGGNVGPKKTIQAGINAASDGDTVLVAAGTYTGPNNMDLDFGGKWIVLDAPNGPNNTIIDCNGAGRGFNFHSGEIPAAAVIGFTITNGQADFGGAIRCEQSNPQIRDCVITGNIDPNEGVGGIYCHISMPTLADCKIINNIGDGVRTENSSVRILDTVELAGNDWVGSSLILYGNGTLQIESDVTIKLDNSTIRCNIVGPGIIQVDLDSELTIESDAIINLAHDTDPNLNGKILCDGLLRLREAATVMDAQVYVTRASVEDNSIILNSIITAEAGASYGQFFIEDNVQIWLDKIVADGDRYLDLNPTEFDVNNIHIDVIDVNITEGVGGTHGGLFELRGVPDLVSSVVCDPNNEFFCQADQGVIPTFGPDNWTINRLELVEGAKLNLTNRFDFQAPYDSGGDEEVLYVKHLVLGPNSVLNTAFNRLYYETLIMDSTAKVVNMPLLGFSLVNISFNDENDYLTRVKHNNFEHPPYSRTHVERVGGLGPDPNGMMRMCNLVDLDSQSPTYQQVINARAKGLFAKASEDEILIWFEYLFLTSDPAVELVIYLTDVPELLDHGDPDRASHYIEVARLSPPPAGKPGSDGSGRFGVFQEYVSTWGLDFIKGTRIEFELIGPEGTCLLINNWDPQVHCNEIYCADVTGDLAVTVLDFLTVLGGFGGSAGLTPEGGSTSCLDGVFSTDGTVDLDDIMSWDWLLNNWPLNACGIPLTGGGEMATATASMSIDGESGMMQPLSSGLPVSLSDILIAGKRGTTDGPTRLKDYLYVVNNQGQYIDGFEPAVNRANTKLITDPNGELYQLNSENGLMRLEDGNSIVPSGSLSVASEPRYDQSATVFVGLQGDSSDWSGIPISDAAFDSEGFLYVVPVVVDPVGEEAYLAAAKLELQGGQTPYNLIKLYDDPPLPNDNQERNALREIEVDNSGNVYVINSHNLNESDMLWAYDTNTGAMKDRLDLSVPGGDVNIPAPIALCASKYDSRLYLASSKNPPDANSDVIYGLSTNTFGLERTITIDGMGHITSIVEDPDIGSLWVAGFTMVDIPEYLEENDPPFYYPYLAEVPYGNNGPIQAIYLSGVADLALPLSIVWTKIQEKCGGADLDGSGEVNFADFAKFAQYWLETNCVSPDWCGGADLEPQGSHDGDADMADLAILTQNWLKTGCTDP